MALTSHGSNSMSSTSRIIISRNNRLPFALPISFPLPKLVNFRLSKLQLESFLSSPPPAFFPFRSSSPTTNTSSFVPLANTTSASDVLISATPIDSSTAWSEFARNVSGEWDGFGADFTPQGCPIELPESVVPEAYREWEVKVFDWQTQCPTLAQTDHPVLAYKTIKLLPTVGCEADAATRHSIDERFVGGSDGQVSAFAYQSNGSYVAVWPTGDNTLELEHCLINPKDRESRVRVIQVVRIADARVQLEGIQVFCEQWYGPFRNGDQLGGCAIRDSAFAATAALETSQVTGIWEGPNAVASFDATQSDLFQELLDESVLKSVREGSDLILLPKQLWCSVKEIKDGGSCCEVGWVFEQGCAVTSACSFSSNAKLKEICIARQTAT